MPKVSVCIPSYQLAPFIAEAVRGVLAQTFTDFELLVEDDGSTDESVQVISQFNDPRIKVFAKFKNEGANQTTNNLVKRAVGEYIALHPADDVWSDPEKLAKQVAYLDEHPDCGVVFGQPRFMDERGQGFKYPQEGIEDIPAVPRRAFWQEKLRGGNCLFIATSLYRRSLHEELGYFALDLPLLADLDWWTRIVSKHDLHVIEEPLALIRIRDGGANLSAMKSFDKLEQLSDELEMVRSRNFVKRDKPKFMFATPFYDVKGFSPYIVSMFQTCYAMAKHTTQEFDFIELSGDSYVWRARNLLVERFLMSDATHIIFIDSDQSWSLESMMRVLKADGDVVAGVYPSKNDWENYACTVYTDDKGIPDVGADGLIRAQKAPTGFMKIKREVFDTLRKKLPHNWYWEGLDGKSTPRKAFDYFGHLTIKHVKYGEDISFCKRCEMAGLELFIEPRCTISHIGTKTWTGNYHEYLMRRPGGSQDPKLKEAA